MTNPQDIKAAPDLWRIAASLERSANWLLHGIRGGAKSAPHASAPDMLAAAAALRAVQEPVDADAFLAAANKAFHEVCTSEWYALHGPGFGVKAAFLEGAQWAAATPPPPGAASPGVPARPPYKYSWPGDRAPD